MQRRDRYSTQIKTEEGRVEMFILDKVDIRFKNCKNNITNEKMFQFKGIEKATR